MTPSDRTELKHEWEEKGPAPQEIKPAAQAIFLPAENLRLRLFHCFGPEQHRSETSKASSEQVDRV